MNTVGWTGGFDRAGGLVGFASEHFGLGVTIASTAAVYLLGGVLAFQAARAVEARQGARRHAIFSWIEGFDGGFTSGQEHERFDRVRLGPARRHQRLLRADARQHRRHDLDGQPAGGSVPHAQAISC